MGATSARTRGRRRALLAAGALALSLGCRPDQSASSASIVHLAAAYQPQEALVETAEGGRSFELAFELEAEDWIAQPDAGLWRARAPWYDGALPVLLDEPAALLLEGGETPPRRKVALDGTSRSKAFAPLVAEGSFALFREADGDYLFLGRARGAPPPPATVRARVSAGSARGGRWRVAGGPLAGDGFLVRPGPPAVVEVDVPSGSRLVLDAVCVPEGREARGEEVVLRVRLDGALLGERILRAGEEHVPWPLVLPLPPEERKGARVSFELEGEAWCALYGPRLAPVESAPSARPDVIVFLADTLRADALGVQGGPAGLTPALDAFAAQGLRFARTWAPACWTLPSHASLFLGAYPPQHGAVAPGLKPGADLVTLAERLRAAGYRTAAVTDGLFVSRRFDLDRGFERFEEYDHRDLDRTLRRARELAADHDGRPLFLFVHSYRTHEPYEASAETRAALGARLGIEASWEDLEARVQERLLHAVQGGNEEALRLTVEGDFHALLEALRFTGPEAEDGDGGEAFVESVRALYLGGVHDLDRGFATFLSDLDARPRARDTWVIFTSDHGEAFQEHATMFHGAGAWEEILRVPLIVRGPGLRPGVVDRAASLVDLPRTIAEITGVAPDPRWGGRSLLSRANGGPIFAFDCAQRGEPVAMFVENGLKVYFAPDPAAIEEARVLRAFDLERDPGEVQDLKATPRARTALEGLAARALELLLPLAPAERADLDARARQQMAKMGYVEGAEETDGR